MATQVVLGANIKKTSERINTNGDIVNARTKQVIEPNVEVYTPTPEEVSKTFVKHTDTFEVKEPSQGVSGIDYPNMNTPRGSLSILEQIKQAEENLKALKELKKLKIAEKKAELELLEQ